MCVCVCVCVCVCALIMTRGFPSLSGLHQVCQFRMCGAVGEGRDSTSRHFHRSSRSALRDAMAMVPRYTVNSITVIVH